MASQDDDLLLEIHHLLIRSRPQSQCAHDLESTLHFRLQAVSTAHHALVELEAARSNLQSEAGGICTYSQSIAPGVQLSIPSASSEASGSHTPPLPTSFGKPQTTKVNDGIKQTKHFDTNHPTPNLSEKARGKLRESTDHFAATYGHVMNRFETVWIDAMADATRWRTEMMHPSPAAADRGEESTNAHDVRGGKRFRSAGSDIRPLRSWFTGHGLHAINSRSAEICLRTIRVAVNDIPGAARCITQLDSDGLKALLQNRQKSNATPGKIGDSTDLHSLMGIIAATIGADGVLRFAEQIFLHTIRDLEIRTDNSSNSKADSDQLLLAVLSFLEAMDWDVRSDTEDPTGGSQCDCTALFSPSGMLELELLHYLKEAKRIAAEDRHHSQSMQAKILRRTTSTASYPTLQGKIGLPSIDTLHNLGANAADFWNASMAGGMATISGLWGGSAQPASATGAAHMEQVGMRPRTKSAGAKALGTATIPAVPASLSLSRFVSTPPPPSTSPTRNRAVAELSSPPRQKPDLTSRLSDSSTSSTRIPSMPTPVPSARIGFPLSDVLEDESSLASSDSSSNANEPTRRRTRLTSLTSALGFFDQRGRSSRTRALSDAAGSRGNIRIVRDTEGAKGEAAHLAQIDPIKATERRDPSPPKHSRIRIAAARIAWTLLDINPDDLANQAARPNPKRKSATLPLPLALARSLLSRHFPPGTPNHRKMVLLVIIRWYAFIFLGGLLMNPESCSSGLQGGSTAWGRNALHLPFQNTAKSGDRSSPRTRIPGRMMHDTWLADKESSQALGELHRELYRAIVRAAGFGPGGSTEAASPQNLAQQHEPRSRSSTPKPPRLDSLDRAALALVEMFGLSSGSSATEDQGGSEMLADPAPFMSTFALKAEHFAAALRTWTPLFNVDPATTILPEDLTAKDGDDPLTSGSATPRARSRHEGDASLALKELKELKGKIEIGEAATPCVLLFSAIQSGTNKILIEQTLNGIERQYAKLQSQGRSPISPEVDHLQQYSFASTGLVRTNSATTNGTFASSIPSSSDGLIPFPRTHNEAASVAWSSPPTSPHEGQERDVAPEHGFFHLESDREKSSSNSPTIASRLLAHASRHGRDSTATMTNIVPDSISFLEQTIVRTASQRSREVQFRDFLRQANIPLAEIRHGILLLLRREAPIIVSATKGSALLAALGNAERSSRAAFDFDAARVFQRTAKWLQHIAAVYPLLAHSAQSASDQPETPPFTPLLAYICRPLRESEIVTSTRIQYLHNALADVEVHRHGLVDRARVLIARVHELRVRVWFATTVRCSPQVMSSCYQAAKNLEQAMVHSPDHERSGSSSDEHDDDDDTQAPATSSKAWMRNLGIYDFGIGPALESYFRDLDPAFTFIACEAKTFFSSSLWSREAMLARPFLNMSADQSHADADGVNNADGCNAMLPSGEVHISLLHAGELRVHTLVGLENFLQRVQLLSTGLLLSEALAGLPSSPTDTWLASRLDEASPQSDTADVSGASRFALQNSGLASALSRSGARELLRRFELQPSPHHKMRALLALERLVISELSGPRVPHFASFKQSSSLPAMSPSESRASNAQQQLEAARVEVRRREASALPSVVTANTPNLPSPLQRPSFARHDSATSAQSATRTRTGTSTSGVSVSGRSAQPDSHRPLSMRVTSANVGRRVLSMYEDKDQEGGRGGGLGLMNLNAGGPSIHELLSGLAKDMEDDGAEGVPRLHGPSVLPPIDTASLNEPAATSTSTTTSPGSFTRDTSAHPSGGIPFPTGAGSSFSDNSRSTSSISSRTYDAGDGDSQARWGRVSDHGGGNGSTDDETSTQDDDDEPPNTDMVVNALESILLNSSCRPADLICTLQLICAFSPTCVIDLKDEGKAMWDLALASLSLRREAAMSELQTARAKLASLSSGVTGAVNDMGLLTAAEKGQIRSALKRGEEEGAELTLEERKLANMRV